MGVILSSSPGLVNKKKRGVVVVVVEKEGGTILPVCRSSRRVLYVRVYKGR